MSELGGTEGALEVTTDRYVTSSSASLDGGFECSGSTSRRCADSNCAALRGSCARLSEYLDLDSIFDSDGLPLSIASRKETKSLLLSSDTEVGLLGRVVSGAIVDSDLPIAATARCRVRRRHGLDGDGGGFATARQAGKPALCPAAHELGGPGPSGELHQQVRTKHAVRTASGIRGPPCRRRQRR